MRRDEAGEDAADHAAEREREIETGQVGGMRTPPRQFPMVCHRDHEKRDQMHEQRERQILVPAAREEHDQRHDRHRLQPQADFRETVPALRQNGYIGPIGVISSSISDAYFQKIDDYGVDFRIDKAELDPTAIEFILQEYVKRDAGAGI